MKSATKNLFLKYFIKSIVLVFVSVFALYQLSSQTPKGIAFGILLSLFGLITALFGWLLVFIKKQHNYQVYILAITASTINLYLLILFSLYPIESSFTLVGTLINLFTISGVIAAIILLSRVIKFIGHQ